MRVRGFFKYHLRGPLGSFRYFGERVFFPRRCVAFAAACDQGVFEADNVRLMQVLAKPNTFMFDVGANLGLMALPVLQFVPNLKVVSFEPSPNVLPWLKRTVEAYSHRERWHLVQKAVSSNPGKLRFTVSPQGEGLYDGLRDTRRATSSKQTEVLATTLDLEWKAIGSPVVSMIKIDVEGGELDVLRGAQECIKQMRPSVLLEWNLCNLRAYSVAPDMLFHIASRYGYRLFALPAIIPVLNSSEMELHLTRTENFLMTPHPTNS